jgi:hypothetical protein
VIDDDRTSDLWRIGGSAIANWRTNADVSLKPEVKCANIYIWLVSKLASCSDHFILIVSYEVQNVMVVSNFAQQ